MKTRLSTHGSDVETESDQNAVFCICLQRKLEHRYPISLLFDHRFLMKSNAAFVTVRFLVITCSDSTPLNRPFLN